MLSLRHLLRLVLLLLLGTGPHRKVSALQQQSSLDPPTIRVNISNPKHVFVEWDKDASWIKSSPQQQAYVKFSDFNNFPNTSTTMLNTSSTSGVLEVDLAVSALEKVYYFAMGLSPNARTPPSVFGEHTAKWTVAGDCDDYVNAGDSLYPLGYEEADAKPWACAECPTGASCEYASVESGVKARFAYQQVDKRYSELSFDESFHRCRTPLACLGLRTPKSEISENLYPGRLYKNMTSKELGDLVDLPRQNVDPPRCNYEQGYVDSLLCERCGRGYVKISSTKSCGKCGSKEGQKWLLVGIGSTIGFFLFLLVASRSPCRLM